MPSRKPPRKPTRKPGAVGADPAGKQTRRPAGAPVIEGRPPRQDVAPCPVVGIGASAGGLEAVQQMLRSLPVDTGMAFVLVQHLDPTHASMLTEILSRATRLPVTEVTDQMAVEPNHVYVIPPGTDMMIRRGVLGLSPRSEARGPHRTVDHFLRSLAEDQGHKAIGVILSGNAMDGTLGLQAIKAEGGITFAQDDTAQHKSMPRSAVAAGCVDFVLPPDQIAQEIARISRHPYAAPGGEADAERAASGPNLGRVLEQLRFGTGVDFSNYKRSTLYRRISRRAVLHNMEDLGEYVRFLQGDPAEVEALYQDVLLSVTSFFRNPEAFEVLKSKVFPRLTEGRSRHEPIRVWVVGCSTGEEAYSIAIAFAEFVEASGRQIPLQLFATDLNGAGIERARAGIYSKSIAQDVSPERLRRFFVEIDGQYRITKSIRDACVFARHNLLTEPPFSRMDLVSCRNLLIYLEPTLQQQVMAALHYALKPTGVLWLGSSETIGAYRDLLEVEDTRHKIYVKKPGAARTAADLLPILRGAEPKAAGQRREIGAPGADLQREVDRLLLARYAPASLLVNADLEIVQFRGETGRYLAPAPGKASLNLLKMLREGLLVGVRTAVHKAKREEAPVRETGLRVRTNGGVRSVDVQVILVKGDSGAAPYFLVLFEEVAPAVPSRAKGRPGESPKARVARRAEPGAAEREIARLTQELAATREYLQSVIEQHEAANEELQSSNEEAQSANEELQSINEELETSKEEIQSSNEELATVNEELNNRNLELAQSNNDFVNLLASVQLPILMLGPDLRIRRFTPMAEKLFNLIPADVGRPISDIKLNVDIPDLESMLGDVVETVSVKEREIRDKQGRWHLLRIRPYRTLENKIDGAVLLVIDVEGVKRSEERLRRQGALLDQAREATIMWELDGGITYWNKGAEDAYGYTREQVMGRNLADLLATSPPPSVFKEALLKHGQWTGELTQVRQDGAQVVVESRMALEPGSDPKRLVFETNHVITERKEMEKILLERARALTDADRSKNEFLAMLAHDLRSPLAALGYAVEIFGERSATADMIDQAKVIMSHQIQTMAQMIDDLFDVTELAQGRVTIQHRPVKVATLVTRAVEAVRQKIEARSQSLSVSVTAEDTHVEGDVSRLEQVLVNLLYNASKFTPPGGHIWLTAERGPAGVRKAFEGWEPGLGEDERGQLVIRVRDDGIGIAADLLPRVFDLFVQADRSPARERGGLGIGLTIVRRLTELHGGRVEASSPGLGQGSEFVVRLPIMPNSAVRAFQEASPREAPPQETPVHRTVPRRVLVVDDSVDAADALAMILTLEGHEVQVTHDGLSAINSAARFRPDVVFLDIGMPGMDGYEVARQLRQLPGLEGLRVVAVTGYGRQRASDLAAETGIDRYLIKPVSLEAVRQILAESPPGRS